MLAHVAVVAVYKELHITECDAAVLIICTLSNNLIAFKHFKRELILFKGCTQKLLISLQRKYSFRLIFILKYHFRNRRPVLIGNARKNRKRSVAGVAYHHINRVCLAAVCHALQITCRDILAYNVSVDTPVVDARISFIINRIKCNLTVSCGSSLKGSAGSRLTASDGPVLNRGESELAVDNASAAKSFQRLQSKSSLCLVVIYEYSLRIGSLGHIIADAACRKSRSRYRNIKGSVALIRCSNSHIVNRFIILIAARYRVRNAFLHLILMLTDVIIIAVDEESEVTKGDAAVGFICACGNNLVALINIKCKLTRSDVATLQYLICLESNRAFSLVLVGKYYVIYRISVLIGNGLFDIKSSVALIFDHQLNRVDFAAVLDSRNSGDLHIRRIFADTDNLGATRIRLRQLHRES